MQIQKTQVFLIGLQSIIILLCLNSATATTQSSRRDAEWPDYAGNQEGMKYSPLNQISKENIQNIEILWRKPTVDQELQASSPARRGGRYEDTPLMVNGMLYTVTPLGLISALDPANGETIWIYDPEAYTSGRPANVGFLHRGLSYWTDGTEERLILGTNDARLVSVDARTGEPHQEFGNGGKVDIMVGIRDAVRGTNFAARRALIAGDVIVVGNAIADGFRTKQMPPGDIQAYDIRTGKKLWTFHTIPKEYEFGYETWLNGSAEYSGNANVWNGMAYDPELNYVYLPTSTPTHNEYGGNRHGDNLYAESLVCVDAMTGKRIWHFQAVHHGVWDYDFATRPILADLTVNGKLIKAVIQVSKQAFTYVFDRATGEPVWPIEERPVATDSDMEGEVLSPTQPFPTKPPPFEYQGVTVDDLVDFTPEIRAMAIEAVKNFQLGPLFSPPTLSYEDGKQGTIQRPHVGGGAGWAGAAADPETGLLYVPSMNRFSVIKYYTPDPAEGGNLRYTMRGLAAGIQPRMPQELPLLKPPYTRTTAIDLNEGDHAWMQPNGDGNRIRNHPLLRDLDLPPLGGDGRIGLVLTKTLLISALSAGGTDDGPRLIARDKASGQIVGSVDLPARAIGTPMTYMHNGAQYVALTIGGEVPELVALRLP